MSPQLELHDPIIPENNGVFSLVFSHGRALRVEKTHAAPDVRLEIPAFSALISGVCSLDEAVCWMDGIQVCNPGAPLDGIFYAKPLFLWDSF